MEALWQDVRMGIRGLVKRPGFSLLAIFALALGIGPNTALFSIYNALVLRPLPVPQPERVVSLYTRNAQEQFQSAISYLNYADLRDRNTVLEGLAAYAEYRVSASIPGPGQPLEEVHGMFVSGNYFSVLQIGMALGHGLPADDVHLAPEGAQVVLSNEFWQRRFRTDPNVLGKTLRVNFVTCTITGVAAAGFTSASTDGADLFLPMASQPLIAPGMDLLGNREMGWLHAMGRLKPGVELGMAQAELSTLMGQLAAPGQGKSRIELTAGSLLTPPEKQDATLAAAFLMAAVSLVLLVVCANVANLMLARNAARKKEIGVCLSLGAGRWRIVRRLLAESVMLSMAGGLLGLLMAFGLAAALVAWIHPPGDSAANLDLTPDLTVFGYAFGVALTSGIACALWPALRASRVDPVTVLRGDGIRVGDAAGGTRLRAALVAGQVAASAILLVGSGLLARALVKAQHTNPGFQVEGVFIAAQDLSLHGYDAARAQGFLSRLRAEIAKTPGIASVAFGSLVPLGNDFHMTSLLVQGREPAPGAEASTVNFSNVSPEFFETLGMSLVRGREFTAEDLAPNAAPVVIVNESIARKFWPGEEALGKYLRTGRKQPYSQVVGIARDTRSVYLWSTSEPYLYLPARTADATDLRVFVRTEGKGISPVAALLEASRSLDPAVVLRVQPLEKNLEFWIWPSQVGALLAALLGGLAMALASLGLYGVVSFLVGRRTHEIGVRMALGAEPRGVLTLVMRQGIRMVAAGLFVGLAVAAASTRVLAKFLYGVSAMDWLTFVGVSALLTVVAMVACYVPARRAARVDPMVALRYE